MTSTYQRILDPYNNMIGYISLEHTCDCMSYTNITQTWMIPTKYMMVHLQITCVNKRFITHIIALFNTDVTSGYLCH